MTILRLKFTLGFPPKLGLNPSSNKAIDVRLRLRTQHSVCLHSQTSLCTAKLAADGCQSVGGRGNAERGGAKALKLHPVCGAYR